MKFFEQLVALFARKFLCCHRWYAMEKTPWVLRCDGCGRIRTVRNYHQHRYKTDREEVVTRTVAGQQRTVGHIYYQVCDGCGERNHYEATIG